MAGGPPSSTPFPSTPPSRSGRAAGSHPGGPADTLHDLPHQRRPARRPRGQEGHLAPDPRPAVQRSEEHTSELQSRQYLVCRLLLEKKKNHYLHRKSANDDLL